MNLYFVSFQRNLYGEKRIFPLNHLIPTSGELYYRGKKIEDWLLALYLNGRMIGIYQTGKIAENLKKFRSEVDRLERKSRAISASMSQTGAIVFMCEGNKTFDPIVEIKRIADELFG